MQFRPPSQGEPIDLSMMSQMAQYIYEMNTKTSSGVTSSLEASNRLIVPSRHVAIWTGKIHVQDDIKPVSSVKKLKRYTWKANFDGANFTSTPIVTATNYCDTTGGGTQAANTCWIKQITPQFVSGTSKFTQSPYQTESLWVLIIAVGLGTVQTS